MSGLLVAGVHPVPTSPPCHLSAALLSAPAVPLRKLGGDLHYLPHGTGLHRLLTQSLSPTFARYLQAEDLLRRTLKWRAEKRPWSARSRLLA